MDFVVLLGWGVFIGVSTFEIFGYHALKRLGDMSFKGVNSYFLCVETILVGCTIGGPYECFIAIIGVVSRYFFGSSTI